MNYKNVPIGKNPPDEINVIVENPTGGEPVKYEFDKCSGHIVVDRFLHTAMRYPGNYGFIPHTLSEDGDPIDVIVISSTPVVPGAILHAVPIGVFVMEDDSGRDEKIIAVPTPSTNPQYKNIKSYKDLPELQVAQIAHFFEHYKDLEPGKWVKSEGWGDADVAKKLINEAIDRAKKNAPSLLSKLNPFRGGPKM